MIRVVDLKNNEVYLKQYVDLRNSYKALLLTNPVTVKQTEDWLKIEDIEIRCIVENNIVIGVVILYINKGGEIAFFVKTPGRGVGSNLLQVIEPIAREKEMRSIWAWVLSSNMAAQKAFTKNGYMFEREQKRIFKNKEYNGIVYRKEL